MRSVLLAGFVATALAGCSTAPGNGPDDGARVVATTTFLGDLARQLVECGGGTVRTLMPVGTDPHDYAPSSADVTEMVRSDLVVANGLGLEEGLASALKSAADDGARVLEVAPALDPIEYEQGAADGPAGEAADEPSALDPHVWLDAARMARGAELIGAELADATGDPAYAGCATDLAAELRALDTEVRERIAAIPAERRIMITDHDAFGYFAAAYGLEVAGVVIPGGSTLGEPSTAWLAELVATIDRTGVPVVFANTSNPSALVRAVAAESGRDVQVVELFEGSLGEAGSGAETYQGLLRTDAERIARALAG